MPPTSVCPDCKCHPCVCGQPEPSDEGWLATPASRRASLASLASLAFLIFLSSPTLAQRGPRPPKPPTKKVCPTCYGTGQIVISGGQSRRCPRCGGKGFIQ